MAVILLLKEDRKIKKAAGAAVGAFTIPRWIKTLFFLVTMFASFLFFSAPILLIVSDAILPSALLSATLPPSSRTLSYSLHHLRNYDFRHSLVDIPIISITRSAIIFCVYSFCDGPRLSRWPYLGVTTACSAASLVFVTLKGSNYALTNKGGGNSFTAPALFIWSVGLAIGHVVVAYRTSCRERRKLLIYKIDIEAVSSAYCNKNGFPKYHPNTFLQGNKY